jgi:hypothetical protein
VTGPTITAIGASWFVVWAPQQVTFEFSRIAEHTETVTAEVAVTSPLGEAAWGRLNLLASTARGQLAKSCLTLIPDYDWSALVETSCKMLVRALRVGAPPVDLEARAPEPDWVQDRWLVPSLIPRRQITVLYADGGVGKSLLALAIAVSGLQGHPLSSAWPVGTLRRVLYLDWESAADDHQERLWRLTAGREALPQGAVRYHRLHRPLTDHTEQIQAIVAKEGIDLVITDSLGAACGSEPETNDAALRTFGALRAIDSTHLVLAHVSKSQADSDGPRRPFGGVYVVNTARSTIEARRVDDGDPDILTMTLHHRKTNVGRPARPSALAFTWDQHTGYVLVTQAKPDMQSASLSLQILEALKAGKETVAVIAETIDGNEASIKTALHRMENRGRVLRFESTEGGRGKKTQWGLTDTNRSSEL